MARTTPMTASIWSSPLVLFLNVAAACRTTSPKRRRFLATFWYLGSLGSVKVKPAFTSKCETRSSGSSYSAFKQGLDAFSCSCKSVGRPIHTDLHAWRYLEKNSAIFFSLNSGSHTCKNHFERYCPTWHCLRLAIRPFVARTVLFGQWCPKQGQSRRRSALWTFRVRIEHGRLAELKDWPCHSTTTSWGS